MFSTKDVAIAKGIPVKEFGGVNGYKPSHWGDDITKIENVLIFSEVEAIIEHFEKDSQFYDVGVQGLPSNTAVGSKRVTVYDEEFAKYLTPKLASHLEPMHMNTYDRVDWISENPDKLNYWVPIGVSNVFRYMKYPPGSPGHYTHYDAPFKHPDNPLIRTLKSGVVYLTSNDCLTRFIRDGQNDIPFVERDHSDWDRPTLDVEVYRTIGTNKGTAVLFDHQLAHDVSANLDEKERIIIRFDILYMAVARI